MIKVFQTITNFTCNSSAGTGLEFSGTLPQAQALNRW